MYNIPQQTQMTKKRSAWMYRDAGGYLQVGGFRKDFGDLQFRTVLVSYHSLHSYLGCYYI